LAPLAETRRSLVKTVYSTKLNDFLYLLDLKPFGIEAFISSYVLVGDRVAIVETGPTTCVENLLHGLSEIRVDVSDVDYVAVSHIHIDHAGGAGTLLRHLPKAKLIVHAKGVPHVVRPETLWKQTKLVLGEIADMYGEFQPVPEERVITAKDEMIVDLGKGIELEVLETPGHASHELSFYNKNSKGIFPGDTAGIYAKKFDVVMPTAPAPFHLEMALASIQRLIKLKPKKLYYSHFGQVDEAVRRLEAYIDQLRLWAKIVREEMERGKDAKAIYQRILKEDACMRLMAEFIQNHIILKRGVIMQNIHGFMEYFERSFGTESSSKIHT